MDDNEIMTGAEGAETDGFMDGWEETSPAGEELEETQDGGNQSEEPAEGGTENAGGDQAGGETAGQVEQGTGGDIQRQDSEGAENGGDQAGQPRQEPPRMWTLNHLGQAVSANEADMVTLAQKGLDYDRIRADYDEARPVMDLFRDYAKRAGITVPEYLARIRAQAKQAEGMSQEEARRAVDLEDREAVVAQQEAVRRQQEEAQRQEFARRQAVDARMQADLREFREVFPGAAADPASIPKEVWEAVRNGRTLVAAYAKYQEAQMAAESARRAAVEEKNRQNAALTVGSMRSAGENAGGKDPFLEGWDE